MPQLFQVLRCYKCLIFQVHQTKKSIKWNCKMCGEKQSLKRNYGLGTAIECRKHVQKLNCTKGELNESLSSVDSKTDTEDEETNIKKHHTYNDNKKSKWSNFVDEEKPSTLPDDNDMILDNQQVVLEIPKKIPKKRISKNEKMLTQYESKENDVESSKETSNSNSSKKTPSFNAPFFKYSKSNMNPNKPNIPKVDIEPQEINNQKANTLIPAVSSNSKWAVYVNSNENNILSVNCNSNNLQLNNGIKPQKVLFSLSNEEGEDLDRILAL